MGWGGGGEKGRFRLLFLKTFGKKINKQNYVSHVLLRMVTFVI